ncbi:MAG: UDP-N-acetylmuramoyl-L-alanyl-D-glutamate--2,6-diaminopimelate ligase [Firmicutes bacterium]|nr:UDP-N-acetylmuramoyl-L-alanyl-D-glutamate--2,6-diaminopimelate ligase [Bacillota bacterium]
MYLSKLLPMTATLINPREVNIEHLCHAAWDARPGSLFFCIEGSRTDGHNYAAEALSAGAVALVVSKKLDTDVPQILVSDTRAAMSEIAATFYGYPTGKLRIVGITGTNGKTTTSYIVAKIIETAGQKTAIIGTNGIICNGQTSPSLHTTPDPIELQSTFARLVADGIKYVVMEVSAHAIHQRKIAGVFADATAFTNLSQDHLDYFGTMERYGNTKASYFDRLYGKLAVVNADDEWGQRIIRQTNMPVLTYGYVDGESKSLPDICATEFSQNAKGLSYKLTIRGFTVPIIYQTPGKFNMYNTVCAASIAYGLGIGLKDIAKGIAALKSVEGRFDVIEGKCNVIIDYAHTEDGLLGILSCIEEFAPARIITVFGAGGDRDKTKRKAMGRAVAAYSNLAVITSDNPRFEDPNEIIKEVAKGFEGSVCQMVCIENRKEAIIYAIEQANKDDIVLVAGKGAEKYQEIKGVRHEFSDYECVEVQLGIRS